MLAGSSNRAFDETTAFLRDVLGLPMEYGEAVANMNGYRFFHLRGPDGNVYAMVEGSSALRR